VWAIRHLRVVFRARSWLYAASMSVSRLVRGTERVRGGVWGTRRLRVVFGVVRGMGRCWRRRVGYMLPPCRFGSFSGSFVGWRGAEVACGLYTTSVSFLGSFVGWGHVGDGVRGIRRLMSVLVCS